LRPAAESSAVSARLLIAGRQVYECMWALMAAARSRVRIETYIWKPGAVADRFLQELHSAAARGVRIELLIDAFGSSGLPAGYFAALQSAGARIVWFNTRRLLRRSFRNHRKLMTVDGESAVIGGLNIADEYDGDGISRGWRDFAVELRGAIVASLDISMDHMFELAAFGPGSLRRFAHHYRRGRWRRGPQQVTTAPDILLGGPGTRRSVRMQQGLRADLAGARDVTVYAAYPLPTARMRRAIRAVASRGRVRLVTGARSDVEMVRWAAQHLYPFWLRGGVELYEYLPQVVHAKLIVIDDVVYVGSANLDIRSLRINYEILVRIPSVALAGQVRSAFQDDLLRSRRIDYEAWRSQRRWWHGLRSLWAFLLLVRLDPYLAKRGLRSLS
jgi:cardiolipin synthase